MTTLPIHRGVVSGLALLFALISGSTNGAAQVKTAARDLGVVAGATPVTMTVYLRPEAKGLPEFLRDVQDPASASYRHWLTPTEFGARFGADAAAVNAVRRFAENNGLRMEKVSASGLRVTLGGTATQIEAVFAPGLHAYEVSGLRGVAKTNDEIGVPAELNEAVAAVGAFRAADAIAPESNALEVLSAAVETNERAVVALSGMVMAQEAGAFRIAAQEAAAQGMTVLVEALNDPANFAANADEVAAVAIAPGLAANAVAGNWRPEWQVAPGLPEDGYRHLPDVTATSLNALAAAISAIEVTLPRTADGSVARLGNISATLYALRTTPGLYTQEDGSTGRWEEKTGLGLVNTGVLAQVFPHGVLSVNVSITSSNYAPTHGQSITLSSVVSDTSGQGNGTVPTGTVTFTTSGGVTLGSANLVNGVASVTLNSLSGGTYSVTANYSGDSVYQANHSVAANISVLGEATALTASVAGSVPVGGVITVNAVARSTSGVGTPSGTVTVQPQGTSNSGTYTGTLSGSNGTSTATVQVPATQAGNITLLVSCVSSDPSFTCFTPVGVSVTVTQAPSTTTLTFAPNPPVNGQTTTFTATVAGAATPAPMPTGNVGFYDNGALMGTGTLVNGTATYTSNSISGTTQHNFTATYVGDGNYTTSTSSGTTTTPTLGPTTTALTISPNPPVYGTTTSLVATIAYTSIGTFPTGTVTFYQDGTQLGQAAVASNGTATFTSTVITGTSSHVFYAKYNGDTNYATSTSQTVSTQSGSAVPTTTALVITPNPPVNGTQTTLSATVAYTSNGAAATGTVQFYEDGSVIGSGVLNASGTATFSSSALSSTTVHSFFAKYLGDVNYQASQSNTVITQAGSGGVATTTIVSASTSNVATGGAVTLTAGVTPQSIVNNTAPTGTVTFTSSTQGVLGTGTLTGGSATLTTTLTGSGTQNISATYNGDGNYSASTSSTPVTITVGTQNQTAPLTLSVSPASNVGYGSPVTAVATISGVTTTGGAAPVGTVAFSISGTTTTGATVAFTATSTTGASASYTFAAPPPGTYTVTATCTGTNFTCPTTAATATLVTVKGNTVTVLTATPASPLAGQPTLITAMISAATALPGTTQSFTGMVTFYINGVSAGTGTVTGNTATFSTTLNATTANVVTAVYSGDANWNASVSAPLSLTVKPVTTTGTLTSNLGTALQGSNVIFTASISVMPTADQPNPGVPYGSVTFYDSYNGQQIALGTASLVASGPYVSVAQLSTTGLFHGKHNVIAVFAASGLFAASTSNVLIVTITDYTVTFSPATLTINRGGTASAVATVTALDGFTGTVVLGCTPPAGTSTTCTFSPSVLSGSGTSTLTVSTTAAHAMSTQPVMFGRTGLGISLAAGLVCLMLPRRRRMSLLALVVLCGLMSVVGCGTRLDNNGAANTAADNGTPLGTLQFSIVTSGADGVTTNRHNVAFQVLVQ